MLTREQILQAQDLKVEVVSVPEWGGDVRVRGMTGAERDSFEASLFTGEGDERHFDATNVRARMLVRTIVDEEGKRVFNDTDADALGQRSGVALDKVYTVAQRLCGIGAKELEAAVKKS